MRIWPTQREGTPSAVFAAAGGFAAYLAHRFAADRCLGVAASLSYTSLLALVPLMAIGFGVMSAFPVFDDIRAQTGDLILSYVAPHAGDDVRAYIDGFVANTNRLTALGVVALAVTAVMLLATIESAFNAIWRVVRPRRLVQRLLAYWAVLTFGPVFLGGAFSLTAYLFAAARWAGLAPEGGIGPLARLAPLALTGIAFTLLYIVLPNCRVRWGPALTGGLLAAALFELLKRGFGVYIEAFPAYRTIYGALSSLPLFLIWMYLAWTVVLLGAVLAASWPEWRAERAATAKPLSATGRLARSLKVLQLLLASSRAGVGLAQDELVEAVGGDSEDLRHVLERLAAARYVSDGEDGRWFLSRDLAEVSLHELVHALELGVAAADLDDNEEEEWSRKLAELIAAFDAHARAALSVSVKTLLAPPAPVHAGDEES